MTGIPTYARVAAVCAQAAAVLTATLALALAAPARGRILLVPLTPDAARRLPVMALQAGALLLDRGPLPGSLVVEGDRAAFHVLHDGVLSLAGSGGGCAVGVPA